MINAGSSSPSNPRFYTPPNLEISKGEDVTWRNVDSLAHSITFINPQLRNNVNGSQEIVAPNSELTYNFKESGVYDYYCTFYPFMIGRIIVK
jgi:plastocyanin